MDGIDRRRPGEGSRMGMPAHVVIVVLSWNGRDDTMNCLRSLSVVDYTSLGVVVVDNGSTDGTAEAVQAGFPDVDLVRCPQNLGFADGNNVGIRRALELGADAVLVLNNDVEVEPGLVKPLLEELDRRPHAAAVCPKILFFEPRDRIWFVGATVDLRRGLGRHLRFRELDDLAETEVVESDRACGAAMLVTRAAIAEVGLFDSELFIYAEDTDWSLRARSLGWRHYVVPTSRIYHRVSASSGGALTPTPLYYVTRNTLVVCERWAPLGRIGTWKRRALVVGASVWRAAASPDRADALRAVRDGWRDFRRGRLGSRE
jgi:GT2 family glycosyltransferase